MTDLQQVILFALIAGGTVAHLFDAYYTKQGLAKGLKESNPVNAFLFPKIGMELTTFLEGAAFIATALILSTFSGLGAIAYAGFITALETYMAIRNKKLLK